MHNSFYASGFLYSLKTNQILLLQSKQTDDAKSQWSMLGGESREGEEAEETFQRIVNDLLDANLEKKHIHPVYDYFHDTLGKTNYVFYGEVKAAKDFDALAENSFSWIAFSGMPKLLFSNHTKQDVIVGERVINLKAREDQAIKPI